MNNVDINALIYLVLGGGLAGTITAIGSAYRSYRDGTSLRDKGTIEELVTQRGRAIEERDLADKEKDFALDQRDYWRNGYADLEFVLRQNGIEVPPRGPEPHKSESTEK